MNHKYLYIPVIIVIQQNKTKNNDHKLTVDLLHWLQRVLYHTNCEHGMLYIIKYRSIPYNIRNNSSYNWKFVPYRSITEIIDLIELVILSVNTCRICLIIIHQTI